MAIAKQITNRLDLPAMQNAVARLPWLALIYLFCVIAPVWINLGPLKLSVLRIFLLVLIIPLLVQLFMGRFGRILITDLLMILHLVWMGISLGINSPNFMVSQVGSVGMEFLGGYLVARAYVRDEQAFLALCKWITVIVMSLIPFALYESWTGRPPIIQAIRALPGIDSVAIGDQPKRLGLDRAQTVFAHPIHFGLFCSVSVSMAFVALKDAVSTQRRWATAILSGMVGFLALSSGALLAIALQIGLITWAALFNRTKWRWWLLVGLFILAWVLVDLLSNRSPMRVFMSYATFSAHNAYWRGIIFEWGMKNVWANPIYGIGLNDWVRPDFMFSGSMDNFWLLMAVRYGIPGFLLLAIGYFWAIFLVMRRDFEDAPVLQNIRRAWIFTILGLTFTLATVHVWTSIYSFVFFMFGAGIWLILVDPRESQQTNVGADPKNPRKSASLARSGTPKYSRFSPYDEEPAVHRYRRTDQR